MKDAPNNLHDVLTDILDVHMNYYYCCVEDLVDDIRAAILADRAAASAEQDAPVAEVKRAGSRKAEFFSIALVCWASTCRH